MFLNEEEASALKVYLVRELEPICDADPSVLSDYVIALLKHDQSIEELKELCLSQLTDFLTETNSFIGRLFDALQSKSYIASTKQSISTTNGNSTSFDDSMVAEQGDSTYMNGDNQEVEEGQYMDDEAGEERNFKHGRSSYNRSSSRYSPYGSSNRGGNRSFGQNGMGRGGMIRPSIASMVPRNMRMGRCFEFDEKGSCSKGDSCKFDHTPLMVPPMPPMLGMGRGFRPPIPGMIPPPFFRPGMRPPMNGVPGVFPPQNRGGIRPPTGADMANGQDNASNGVVRPSFPVMDKRFIHAPRPQRDNDTLVVENIPQESFSESAIREYFSKFGTIAEISLDTMGPRALIKFETHAEAYSAYKSPDVIFGNRFVKVYFSKMEFDPVKYEERQEAKTAAFVEQKKQEILEMEKRKKEEKAKQLLEIHRSQEMLIAKQIEQQKSIMKTLAENKNLSPEDKQQLFATLKTLTEQTEDMVAKAAATAQLVKSATPKTDTQMDVSQGGDDAEMATDAALQEKLQTLQAQAHSLGIDPSAVQGSTTTYRGGYMGGFRGRGRGMAIRPGMPASRSLDNRPPKFYLLQVPSNELETIQAHYKSFPGFVSFEFDQGSMMGLVTYESRRQAEIVKTNACLNAYTRIPKLSDINHMSTSWIQPQSSGGQDDTAMAP